MPVLRHGSLNCHMSNLVILLARDVYCLPAPPPPNKKDYQFSQGQGNHSPPLYLIPAGLNPEHTRCLADTGVPCPGCPSQSKRGHHASMPACPPSSQTGPQNTPGTATGRNSVHINPGVQDTAHGHFPGITALKCEALQWATCPVCKTHPLRQP